MEIFNQALRYSMGDLLAAADHWEKPRLCLSATRRFFDLPSKAEMYAAQKGNDVQYILSVHDRKKKDGVRIRINPTTIDKRQSGYGDNRDERKVQVERVNEDGDTIGWSNIGFYHETTEAMMELFDSAKKKFLYVVIESV